MAVLECLLHGMLNAVSGEENKFKSEEGEGKAVSALQGVKRKSCASSAVSKRETIFSFLRSLKKGTFSRSLCLLFVPAPKEVVFEDVGHLGKPAALPPSFMQAGAGTDDTSWAGHAR